MTSCFVFAILLLITIATLIFVVIASDDLDEHFTGFKVGHPNTAFCGRIARHDPNANYRQYFHLNDPLDCFLSPDAYIRHANVTTIDGNKNYDMYWGRCFNFTLDLTVNGWSDDDAALCGSVTVDGKESTNVWCYYDLLRKVFCAAFTNNDTMATNLECGFALDRTSDYEFDASPINKTTWKETIYLKGGSCDNREWEHQDIMFEDMTDLDLQMYNEKFAEQLTCPLLENRNAKADDDRMTRVELKFCQPGDVDRGICHCAYQYPNEFHETLLVGARVEALFGVTWSYGVDIAGFNAQRQQNEQVCISYQTDIVFLSTCFSFCMNVGEEANVMIGNEAVKIRISDANIEKNTTSFSKVNVKVIKRDESGNIVGEYEGYSDDARYDFGNDDVDDTQYHVKGNKQREDGHTIKIHGGPNNIVGNGFDDNIQDTDLQQSTNVLSQWLVVAFFVVCLVFICFFCTRKFTSSNNEKHSSLPKQDGYAKVTLADVN